MIDWDGSRAAARKLKGEEDLLGVSVSACSRRK